MTQPTNEEIARNALRGDLWASSKEVKEALIGSVIKALNTKDAEKEALRKERDGFQTQAGARKRECFELRKEVAELKQGFNMLKPTDAEMQEDLDLLKKLMDERDQLRSSLKMARESLEIAWKYILHQNAHDSDCVFFDPDPYKANAMPCTCSFSKAFKPVDKTLTHLKGME